MRVGDLVREPESGVLGIIIGEVLENTDRWFIQWSNGDMYSLHFCMFEVVNANR